MQGAGEQSDLEMPRELPQVPAGLGALHPPTRTPGVQTGDDPRGEKIPDDRSLVNLAAASSAGGP